MDYYYRFKLITKRARIRFERRDWHGIQADARGRITLYRDDVDETAFTKPQRASMQQLPNQGAQPQDAEKGTKEQSEDFVTAPGIAGMVMYVFTMPTLNMVFKIIRDKFTPPKQVTPARYPTPISGMT